MLRVNIYKCYKIKSKNYGKEDKEFGDELFGLFPGDHAGFNIFFVQGVQGTVNGAYAVRQKMEAGQDALQALVKAFGGL